MEGYALGFHMLLISVGVAFVVLLAAGLKALLNFGKDCGGNGAAPADAL